MFNINQFREELVKPALIDLVAYSEDALELLVFTCANESRGGTYLKQVNGPALGIFQMEPETYNDIWQNYIKPKNSLSLLLLSNFSVVMMPSEDRMVYDLRYATAMARIHYMRVKEALPPSNDVNAMWAYYKQYYNTPKGAATKDEAIDNYYQFVKR